MSKKHKYIAYNKARYVILLGLVLLAFIACQNRKDNYPATLSRAIALFYEENYNDSIITILSDSSYINSIERIKNLQDLSNIFIAAAFCENGETTEAREIFNSIKPNNNDKKLMYYYNSIKSLIEFRSFDISKSYKSLISIIDYTPYDDRAHALNQRLLGRIMTNYSDFKNALYWYLQSNRSFEKAGLKKSIAVNNKFIGFVCVESGNYSDAENYLKASEQTFIEYKDNAELFYLYVILTDIFIKKNDVKNAKLYLDKAILTYEKVQDTQMYSYILLNQAEIEKLNGNYTKSLESFQNILNLDAGYYNSTRVRQIAYINLTQIYNKLNQPEKAHEYANAALGTIVGNTRNDLKYKIYYELAKSYTHTEPARMGVLMDSALIYLNQFHRNQSVDLIKMYNIQHELHEAYHKAEKLQKSRRTHEIVSIVAGVFLTFIAFVAFRISAIRKDKNKALFELVKKNLKILEEEKVSKKLLQEKLVNKSTKKKPLDEEKFNAIYEEFINWLEKDNNYMIKDINLEYAAKEIGTNRDYLSKAISEKNTRFHEIINKYRIEETINIITNVNDKRSKYNFVHIAAEVGFNSQSVFIEAFRKHTGMSPTQFKEHFHALNNETN